MHWGRKWQPTPVFLPAESQGRGAWWAAVYGVTQSRIQLNRLSIDISNTFPFDPVILPVEIYPKNMPEQVQNNVYLQLVLVALL